MFRSCYPLLWLCCLIPATALLPERSCALAGPTIAFTLADGSKISDTATITAKATPDKDVGIEKVEFAVNDQLKLTDKSTPYSFDWDTLEEKEGEYTVTATVFDAKGRTARAKLKVVIDNELGKGADAHADTALEALKAGETERAVRYSRRALIISPTNLKAARALAGIYRANGELNKAVATLDKAEMPPKEIEARKELIALHIAKADESGGTEEFLAECLAAAEIWKKVASLRIEAAKAAGSGPEASLALGDAHFAAHDYQAAIRAYQSTGTIESAPREALGRQALAQIRAGRYKEATSFVAQIVRAGRADETTPVLQSMLALIDHQFTKARDLVEEGAETGSLPAMIARIYTNMPLNKDREAQDLADKIAKISPDSADVQLAIAFAQRDPVDSHKALIRALAIDPALPEAYALHGFHIILGRDKNRYQAADSVLDYALRLDPNNLYALMAKVVCLQAQKRPQEAEPLLAQLLELDKKAPDVHVAQALNLSLLDRTLKITEEMNLALKLDPERWNDVFVPKPAEFPVRVFRYRYQPVMSPATLYPAK
jgi:tetratricopeptide (TPR) repeat protein